MAQLVNQSLRASPNARQFELIGFVEIVFFFFLKMYLFILFYFIYFWLHWVLVAAHRIFVEACGIFCCGARALRVACGFSLL